MRDTTRKLTARAALAALAALSIPAFAATGAASAAQWAELTSPPYYQDATIQGTLSIQRGTYIPVMNPPVECPIDAPYAAVWAANTAVIDDPDGSHEACETGFPLGISFTGGATTVGSMTIDGGVEGGQLQESPFEESDRYTQYEFTVPVVNGTGGTKTKLVFNNTRISHPLATSIRATGDLEITAPTGGTYTIIP